MMKTVFSATCIILIALSFWSCQSSPAPLTESEKEEIKKEVRQAFDAITPSVNMHDADKILQACWNHEDYLYVADGVLVKGWEANLRDGTIIHSNPENQSFTVDYDEIIIKVLSRDAAMLVGRGAFHNILTADGKKSVNLAVTFLMEKIDNEWLITVGHESTQETILIF